MSRLFCSIFALYKNATKMLVAFFNRFWDASSIYYRCKKHLCMLVKNASNFSIDFLIRGPFKILLII